MKKIRLDKLLVERGYFPDTQAALRAVLAHEVKVEDAYPSSAAYQVPLDAEVQVKNSGKYVSRGGLKLAAALEAFDQDVTGLCCIDVGCSTGGFTDCLLQAGAASVTAVDVGYGDLAWKLRNNPKVKVFERTNIRVADPLELGAPFDLAVADLSFIRLAGLVPVFAALLKPGGIFIGLIKPQFESASGETDERGFVADASVRTRTVLEVEDALKESGFVITGVIESPIHGAKSGNVEYLVHSRLVKSSF